jgi:hypothetical protein
MADDHAPRMSNLDYYRCLDTAASATSADDIRRLRDEVIRRWRGDPRADDLTEALYAHQLRFFGNVEQPGADAGESSRIRPRAERHW